MVNGEFAPPEGWRHIRMPWRVIVRRKPNKFGQVCEISYFRNKELGQKPYVPEGFIEIDGELYKVIKNEN